MLLFIFDIYETTFSFQLHDNKKNVILKTEQDLFDGVYNEVLITKLVHYHHSYKNKEMFLKEKRVRGVFIFMLCHHSSKLNLTTIRKNSTNKVAVRLLSFLIVRILVTRNMVLSFFNLSSK